jgi:hypothetical protein
MENYTPATTYHSSAQLPEDFIDDRVAASVRVGIEAALDNAAWLHQYTQDLFAIGVGGTPYLALGAVGGVVVTHTEDSAEHTINNGVLDLEVAFDSIAMGDRIIAIASYLVDSVGVSTYQRLKFTGDATGAYLHQIVHPMDTSSVVTLFGVHTVGAADTECTLSVTTQNGSAAGGTSCTVYGQAMLAAMRIRSAA